MRTAARLMDASLAKRGLFALAALLVAAAGPVAAQGDASAGRFIVVTGEVRILGRDGTSRVAARDGEFRQGESIVTGPTGLAQLRMTDGGAVSVRGDSQLKLDAYKYSGSDDRDASFFVSIVKGGFRTITGLIGRNNRNSYRVSTASATIGIRGTHFEVVHLLKPVADAAPGTYNRVYEGTTTFQNRAGATVLVNREQTAFIPLPSNLPPVLVAPPTGIFGKPTPVPVLGPQSRREADTPAEGGKPATARSVREAPAVLEAAPATSVAPTRSAPLLNPIDSPRVLESSPSFQAVPSSTLQVAPASKIDTTPSSTLQVAPATKIDIAPSSTLQVAPATKIDIAPTTVSPIITAPAAATISPVITAPAAATISPVITAPAAVTISPVIVAPAATIISPVLTLPSTTIQTAPINSTIIKR